MRKYRILSILTLLFLGALQAFAQDWESLPVLREIKGKKLLEKLEPKKKVKDNLWGYVNHEDKFTIKPIFTDACPYEGKVARISLEGKWGAINEKGLFQIFPMYQSIDKFSADSLAVCSWNGKYGLIDTKGLRVVPIVYSSFEYASFGYIVCIDGLYGTIDHKGKILLEPQFDQVEVLNEGKGIFHIKKNGKWGLIREGKEVLTLKWDEPLKFMRSGSDNQPDLYFARQNGKLGVVSLYGDYVVPPIYDNMELSASGDYYITLSRRKYGALSLKMVDIVPAIMDSKPFLGENIFSVYDDGNFYCANVNGSVDFRLCADLYQLFKPEEYVTTKYFPQWAKTHIIEENNFKRRDVLDNAAAVCGKMSEYGFDTELAAKDPDMPSGIALSYPQDWKEKYGIIKSWKFKKTSGGRELYRANEDAENFVSLEKTGAADYTIKVDNACFSINDAVSRFNLQEFTSLCPKEYARTSEDLVMVSFSFARPAGETVAVMTFSLDSLKAVSCHELSGPVSGLVFSEYGGYYSSTEGNVIAERTSPLRRYDKYGRLDWIYTPEYDETFYDIEETENYIYLCGSIKEGNQDKPVIRQLSKRGKLMDTFSGNVRNATYTGIYAANHLLYLKTTFGKGAATYGNEYYPVCSLESMNDNDGVWLKCVWEEWGDGVVGGLGLVDRDGTWLCTPNLTDQMATAFDWEFGGFAEDREYLVVRHMGNFGLVGKDGRLTIDPKYELLEPLENPRYFRARIDGCYGVVDSHDRLIVPFEYSFVGSMNEDIIVVAKDGKYGCFDKEGDMVVPMEYEEIREYVGGMARIRFKNRFGFINKKGDIIVAPFSDEVENFSDGFTLVTIKGKKGFVSLDGDWIAPPMYDSGYSFSGGLAPLAMGGKYGYIDKTGNFVISTKYTDAREFDKSSGLACVSVNGKWGVVNVSGREIIPIRFDKVEICSDGYLYVEENGKCGIYSQSGRVVFKPECDSIERLKGGRLFRHGVANARMNGNRIRIDENGNMIHQYSMLKE